MSGSDPVDLRAVEFGMIPWSLEELVATIDYATKLLNTPQDDWDRRPTRLVIEQVDGTLSGFRFNPDVIENQIGLWLSRRLEEQGYDHTTRMSHAWRFFEIRTFLNTYEARLRDVRLIRPDDESPGGTLIADALLEVLATAKYEGVRAQGPDCDPVPTFHPDRVIEAAMKRQKQEDSEAFGDGI